MSANCVVCNTSRAKSGMLSFHRFPKEQTLRGKWLVACKLQECDIKNDTLVCSKHFKFDDFDESYWPRKKLLPTVVPAPTCASHIKTENVLEYSQLQDPCPITHTYNTHPCHNPLSSGGSSPSIDIKEEDIVEPEHSFSAVSRSPKVISKEIPNPRYVGDLKVEHFSTPEKTKFNLDMVKRVLQSERKKVKHLRVQKDRLQKRINSFKDLLRDLVNNKMSSEEICGQTLSFWKL